MKLFYLVTTALLGLWLTPMTMAQSRLIKDVYGIGVAGNCCTHGAGLCAMFQACRDTRVVAAFEPDPGRAGARRRSGQAAGPIVRRRDSGPRG